MKNKIFIFFSFFLFSFFVYFLFGILAFLELNKNEGNLFKDKENLIFHQKYSKQIHHLRDSNRWGEQKNDYLFTIIDDHQSSDLILLQGDSWILGENSAAAFPIFVSNLLAGVCQKVTILNFKNYFKQHLTFSF